MLHLLQTLGTVKVLPDDEAFWNFCDQTQARRNTPEGSLTKAEYELDFKAAAAIKELLEREVGPEEGASKVQMQNWDWNDDRRRCIYILRHAFSPALLHKLQQLLSGEFADFQVIVVLHDDWRSEPWGSLMLTAGALAVQKNVAQAYAIAA
jgi:hypothetical protein